MTRSPAMLTRINDRPGRPYSSIVLIMVVLASCGPWTPGRSSRVAPAEPRWVSVRLDPSTTVIAIASLVAERDDWRELENVRGVGGKVLDRRGDTLPIRPT